MSGEQVEQGRHVSPPSRRVRWRDRPRVSLWSWDAGGWLLLPPVVVVFGVWIVLTDGIALAAGRPDPSGWSRWADALWTLGWAVAAVAAARVSWLWLKRPVGSSGGSSAALPRVGRGAFASADKGYSPDEVDGFLATSPTLSALRSVRFSTCRPGYDMDEVDAEIDRLTRDQP